MMTACIVGNSPAGGDSPPYGAPVAAFALSAPSIPIYSTANFYDQSTGNPTSWSWRLHDETTGPQFSINQNSAYYFTPPGVYQIWLTVTNSYGSDSVMHELEVFSES